MKTVEAFRCGKCHYTHDERDAAERCCYCAEPGCGREVEYMFRDYCEAHDAPRRRAEAEKRKAERAAEDRAQFEKAERVDWRAYDGPVYAEGMRGTCGEGYYNDVAELIEDLDPDAPTPAYCWATTSLPKLRLNADNVLEGYLDDYFDGAIDHLDVDALQKLLDAWCETNQPGGFEVDYKRAVVLDGVSR